MTWLSEFLRPERNLTLLGLAVLAAWCGAFGARGALARQAGAARWARTRWLAAAAASLTLGAVLAHVLSVHGFFPYLDLPLAPDAGAFAYAGTAIGAAVAAAISTRARQGYRDLLLAGAVLAGSVACMVFLSLSSLTYPNKLAYELLPVTGTVLLAAVLGGFGLSSVRQRGLLAQAQGASCLMAALVVLNAAGLGSILSFSDWMAEADKPASLATEPVVVVVSACGLVVLMLGVVGSVIDHHLALQAARESERLRQLADSAMEGILIHHGGTVVDANAAFCQLVDMPLDRVRASGTAALFHLPPGAGAPWEEGSAGACERQEIEVRAADGSALPVEVLSRSITYLGQPAQVLAVRDIRERRAAEARIRHLAHHDVLTGLANRTLFGEQLAQAMGGARRQGGQVALLYLDLDRFKAVNDTLGHGAGDLLLQQVADRLQGATRASDMVARIGGDEFVILQAGAGQPAAAAALAGRVVEVISMPFTLGATPVSIGVSVGIALCPQDGEDAETLQRHADVALYQAKAHGRGTHRFYDPVMNQAHRERQDLERDLHQAISAGSLALHYQPFMACGGARGEGGAVLGFEALLRWTHPARGPVSPEVFIPLAEETGLIAPLGLWVLETACTQAAAWPAGCLVTVNLSPAQFSAGDLPKQVASVLRRTGLAADRLELEVTEGLLIKDANQALTSLRALKALGVAITLDDFGTGYSSLGYLQRYPFDRLKVDKSFVRPLGRDAGARAITGAILAMARSLDLRVTAEGVETAEQLAILEEQGCEAVQGFLLQQPMPAGQVPDFLRQRQGGASARRVDAGCGRVGVSPVFGSGGANVGRAFEPQHAAGRADRGFHGL